MVGEEGNDAILESLKRSFQYFSAAFSEWKEEIFNKILAFLILIKKEGVYASCFPASGGPVFFLFPIVLLFFLFLKLNHSLFMDDLNFVAVIEVKFTV